MINNKTIGSMFIIAGTSIGAGMLALPIATSGLGFSTAVIVLFLTWGLMTYTALLTLELHQYAPKHATLNTLAKNILGKKGQVIANVAMIFLFYALCSAYIAGGGGQLQQLLSNWYSFTIPSYVGVLLFALIFAALIVLGTAMVDRVNKCLFIIKIIVLTTIFYLLTPHINSQNLLNMPIEQGIILSALPVIVTSFGFHGSIPSVVKYCDVNVYSLRKIMLFGASLPLVIYLLWQLVSQGIFNQQELQTTDGLNSMLSSFSTILHSNSISLVLTVFTNLALATSFLGVSLGLFDFFSDVLAKGNSKIERLSTSFVTFIPPLGFALFYPKGFIMALGFAAIALVILAIFLPVIMVWKQRGASPKNTSSDSNKNYQVKGGKSALITVMCCGVLIIIAQIMQVAGVIPKVG